MDSEGCGLSSLLWILEGTTVRLEHSHPTPEPDSINVTDTVTVFYSQSASHD
jgi:hypothetical protein